MSNYYKDRNDQIRNDNLYYSMELNMKYCERIKLLSKNYNLSVKGIESILFPRSKVKTGLKKGQRLKFASKQNISYNIINKSEA